LSTPDAKEIWVFGYNKHGAKKIDEALRILTLDDDKIISILSIAEKKKSLFCLLVSDIKTGKF